MNPETTFAIATAPKRNSRHWTLGRVSWSELVSWLAEPADRKESGNYVLGTLKRDTTVLHSRDETPCTNVHRRKDFVVSRSAITLDVDTPGPDFVDRVELAFGHAVIMHTTFSSSPDAPRYRLIIPTDREMAPDEYVHAASAVMDLLGAASFDPGSSQPERYMFKPAASEPTWFGSWVFDGEPVGVDGLLDGFELDLASKPMPRPHKNKRDPFSIDGVIGAFNTAYADWDLLIDTYDLPYDKVDDDRYQLIGARSMAGMGPIAGADGLVYSHHANDPAYGKTCSAFDLVRLHRFGELDEDSNAQTPVNKLPSHSAMLDLATTDHRVTAQLVGLDFDAVTEGLAADDAWKLRLDLTNTGVPKDKVANWDLIRNHDPVFGGLFFNRFSLAIETRAALPWREIRPIGAIFNEVDEAQLRDYIEREYRIRPTKDRVEAMVRTTAQERWVNPVLDYLNGLTWDGTSRIETALPGVRPTAYTRMVSRKSLVAAVARVFEPGIKWDHTLVLYGSEGLGKSWWIEKMATVGPPEMGRSNYSASLTKIDSKDTLIQMNMNWIMVSDEGHSMRKADNDALKEFLTKTKDLIRMPYDRDTHSYPRSCVIWSTTNDETFLRRQEGNRRFLIVHCQDRVDFGAFDAATVDQIWAEAVYLFKAGEGLFLDLTEAELAAVERERYTEEDAIAGMIDAYVSMRVPANWDEMTREARAEWKFNRDLTGFDASGDHTIDRVCTLQIYAEALGQDPGRHQRKDLLEIAESLKRMGWVAAGRHHFPPYGRQLVYARPTEPAEPEPEPTLDELL